MEFYGIYCLRKSFYGLTQSWKLVNCIPLRRLQEISPWGSREQVRWRVRESVFGEESMVVGTSGSREKACIWRICPEMLSVEVDWGASNQQGLGVTSGPEWGVWAVTSFNLPRVLSDREGSYWCCFADEKTKAQKGRMMSLWLYSFSIWEPGQRYRQSLFHPASFCKVLTL